MTSMKEYADQQADKDFAVNFLRYMHEEGDMLRELIHQRRIMVRRLIEVCDCGREMEYQVDDDGNRRIQCPNCGCAEDLYGEEVYARFGLDLPQAYGR